MTWKKTEVRNDSGKVVRRDYTSDVLRKTNHYKVDSAGSSSNDGYTRNGTNGRSASYDRNGKKK